MESTTNKCSKRFEERIKQTKASVLQEFGWVRRARMSFVKSLQDFTAGASAGIAQVLVGHPLDTIKVRLQTAGRPGAPQFDGIADCFRKTIAAEGVKGLYKGMVSPLIGLMAMNSWLFLNYASALRLISGQETSTVSASLRA